MKLNWKNIAQCLIKKKDIEINYKNKENVYDNYILKK